MSYYSDRALSIKSIVVYIVIRIKHAIAERFAFNAAKQPIIIA